MKIEKLYLYPVKSLRGITLETATLTKYGFPYDRSFMLLQIVDKDGKKEYKNMSVANYNEMVRFFPEIRMPSDGDASKATMKITFNPINDGKPQSLEVPLVPDTSTLEKIDVLMHLSPTQAYKMDDKYNAWFSSCFGYDCVLAYIGENTRPVRMSSPHAQASTNGAGGGWLSSISSITSKASEMVMGSAEPEPKAIRFSDVAPYLIVSSKSMDDVFRRLPEGEEKDFDIIKFRPNIIVSDAKEAWEEDYWGELTIGEGGTKLECEHNCGRCRSINIDYNTGAQGTGEAGKMLKMLSKDRRVDKGAKWTPVFGRYSFLHPDCEGNEIKVDDDVLVSRHNSEHTAFDWKGLSTLPGGGRD